MTNRALHSPCGEGQGVLASLAKAFPEGRGLRLGLMGGTFDPIHFGHLECAERAKEQLALDVVLFVPTGNPHFKQGTTVASCIDRLTMCEIACMSNELFGVSDMEIVREGITYTIDTLDSVREVLPHVELFFILGSDAFMSLPGWKESSRLVREMRFAVLLRGEDARQEVETLASRIGAQASYVASPRLDVSSSYLREAVAGGRSIRYLVPDAVCSYIAARGLYANDQCISESEHEVDCRSAADLSCEDALSRGFFEARKEELVSRVSPKRLRHIEGVVDTARRLSRVYGCDEDKAALAGLLHDWDKGYDDEGIRARVVEVGLGDVLDPFVVRNMPQVLHGPTAACALKRQFPQIPSDVIRAVYNHTTASVDADDLEKILYIADAIEPSRTFDSAGYLRERIGEASLDELFFCVYKFWTLALLSRDKVLHPDTMTIWNALAAQRDEGAKGKAKHRHGKSRKGKAVSDKKGHKNGKSS